MRPAPHEEQRGGVSTPRPSRSRPPIIAAASTQVNSAPVAVARSIPRGAPSTRGRDCRCCRGRSGACGASVVAAAARDKRASPPSCGCAMSWRCRGDGRREARPAARARRHAHRRGSGDRGAVHAPHPLAAIGAPAVVAARRRDRDTRVGYWKQRALTPAAPDLSARC